MGISFFLPNLLNDAEKAVPGHGADLVQLLDKVSTPVFFVGVVVGIVACLLVQDLWSFLWARAWNNRRRYCKKNSTEDLLGD